MPGNKKKSNKKKSTKKQKPTVNSINQQEDNPPTIAKVNLDDAVLVEEVMVYDGQGNNNEDAKKNSLYEDIVSEFKANLEQPKSSQLSYSTTTTEHVKFERDFSDFVNNNEDGMKNRNTPEKNFKKKQSNIKVKEDMTIEDYLNLGISREIVMMKHPLASKWVFWWYRNDKSRTWEQNLEKIATVDTIEDFWQVHNYIEPASKLGQGSDYMIFKKGIQPDWADFQNMAGGRWIANIDRNRGDDVVDNFWLEIIFIMIGEHAGDDADMVNGAVIMIRAKTHKLAMWLKDASNMNAVMQIGRLMKSRLNMRERIYFSIHREREDKGNRSRFGSQNSPGKISI